MAENFNGGFETLEAWKQARKLRQICSKLAKKFPDHEKYKLNDQLTRAVRSVGDNIAEGYGRFHYQENIQFCRQARGSLNETLGHLITAFDETYISTDELAELRKEIALELKLINGYIAYLKKRKSDNNNNNEPSKE